jgi:hypothetical protein
MVDLHTMLSIREVLAPQNNTGNTAMVGAIIDRAGFDGIEFSINLGAIATAAASFAILIEDGNNANLSDNATVSSTYLIGPITSFAQANQNSVLKFGYVGWNRYTRLTITPSSNSGNAFISAVAILGGPKEMPVTS